MSAEASRNVGNSGLDQRETVKAGVVFRSLSAAIDEAYILMEEFHLGHEAAGDRRLAISSFQFPFI